MGTRFYPSATSSARPCLGSTTCVEREVGWVQSPYQGRASAASNSNLSKQAFVEILLQFFQQMLHEEPTYNRLIKNLKAGLINLNSGLKKGLWDTGAEARLLSYSVHSVLNIWSVRKCWSKN